MTRILIVEDNEADAVLIQEYLNINTSYQYQLQVAKDLKEAQNLLNQEIFEVILLDLNLPDSNGIDTLHGIIKVKNNIPVVLLTGIDDERIGIEAVQLGAQDFLVKNNINSDFLVRSIEYAISRNNDQNKLTHLNKVLKAISAINQLIIKAESAEELLPASCEELVKSNGYNSSWIILNESKYWKQMTTHYGVSDAKLEQLCNLLNNNKLPRCLKNAGKSSNIIISHAIDNGCNNCPFMDVCKGNYAFVRQLNHKGKKLGYMGISISPEYGDNKDEIQLFSQITDDISFSLHTIQESMDKKLINDNYKTEQKKLKTLVNNLPGIAFRCKFDKNWTMEYLSEGCISILGYQYNDIVGNTNISYEDIIYPEDRLWVRAKVISSLEKNQKYSIEYRIITKDGKIKWVWELGTPDYNSQDEITHLDGYISEITDKRNALIDLEKSEENYRLLAENAVDCIWRMDKKLRITYVSPSIKQILGYEAHEVLQKPLSQLSNRLPFVKVARKLIGAINDEQHTNVVQLDTIMISKNGAETPIEITAKTLIDKENNITGLQGSFKDISERIASQKALIESENKFRLIYENSPDLYISFSVKNESVLLCNQSMLKTLNYEKDDLIGTCVFNLYHENNTQQVEKIYNDFLKSGKLKDIDIKLKRKDGRDVDVSLFAEAIRNEQGDIVDAVLFGRDVTEKKHIEELLKKQNNDILNQNTEMQLLNKEYLLLNDNLCKTNKDLQIINEQLLDAKELAEQNEKLKSIFLANMSHEIRTPLNAIMGFSNILEDDSMPSFKRSEFVKHINKAGSRLLQVINDIIDISKIEANQLKTHPEKCNICDVFKESYESFLQNEIYKHKSDLKLLPTISEKIRGLNIKVDANRLGQVLDNLLSNAIKYSEKGTVEFGYSIEYYDNQKWIEVFVKDTGIGIPDDKKELIFERFRQIEEMEYHQSYGLGLSIAKGLVELMGGRIWFTSTYGKGSSFNFIIPYLPEENKEVENNHALTQEIDLHDVKIMIAEDEMTSFTYLKELLYGSGAQITHASNGQELMDKIEITKPNILLLDINMPIKSGFVCLKEIRERGLANDLKIIAQTAYAMTNEKERCIAEGCDEYLSKPFSKDELFTKISHVMGVSSGGYAY